MSAQIQYNWIWENLLIISYKIEWNVSRSGNLQCFWPFEWFVVNRFLMLHFSALAKSENAEIFSFDEVSSCILSLFSSLIDYYICTFIWNGKRKERVGVKSLLGEINGLNSPYIRKEKKWFLSARCSSSSRDLKDETFFITMCAGIYKVQSLRCPSILQIFK